MIEFRKKIEVPSLEIKSEGDGKGQEAPEKTQEEKEPVTTTPPDEREDTGNDQNQTGEKNRLRKNGDGKPQKQAGV